MRLLGEPRTTFNDYKKTGLYIPTSFCTFKCVKEAKAKGIDFVECQNHELIKQEFLLDLSAKDVIEEYIENDPFIECIILSGLDPMDSFEETFHFIKEFRELSDLEIVIFTGYYEHEVLEDLIRLKEFKDITIKFGRYDPSQKPRFDELGEVNLISGNQYFRRLEDIEI